MIWCTPPPLSLTHTHTHNSQQYNTIQYNTIPYNTIQYNTIPYNTIPYYTIPYYTILYTAVVLIPTALYSEMLTNVTIPKTPLSYSCSSLHFLLFRTVSIQKKTYPTNSGGRWTARNAPCTWEPTAITEPGSDKIGLDGLRYPQHAHLGGSRGI